MKIEERDLQILCPRFAAKVCTICKLLIFNPLQTTPILVDFVKIFYQKSPDLQRENDCIKIHFRGMVFLHSANH